KVQVTGHGGNPTSGVGAVVINVAAVNASTNGYLTLWPSDSPQPVTSNVNTDSTKSVSNAAIVKVAADGTISIYNAVGTVDVILDVEGWYATSSGGAGSLYNAMTGSRVLDTRAANRTGVCPG